MRNHFLFPYAGNKRLEVENIYNKIKNNLDDILVVVEPFVGSASISYFIRKKHPKKFKYILNDNNEKLIKLYRLMSDDDEKEIKTFEKNVNDIINTFNSFLNDEQRKQYYLLIKNMDSLESYFFTNKYYNIVPGLYPTFSRLKKIKSFSFNDYPIYEFLVNEDVEILFDDATEIYKKYKDIGKSHLIILDPPYLSLNNDFYENKSINIYEYLYENNISESKSFILFILENIWIIKLLFKNNFFSEEYDKTYERSKSKTKHVIISNF